MPFAAMRPCLGGCGKLVSRGRCEACSVVRSAVQKRPTAAARGYGSKWQKASAGFLRNHPLCVGWPNRSVRGAVVLEPEADGYHGARAVKATETDHVQPHRGDRELFWDRNNWQPLCHDCHSRKTATEDGGFGRRINAGTD